jgi:hypothetical protein
MISTKIPKMMFQDPFIALDHEDNHRVTEMCYCMDWDIVCVDIAYWSQSTFPQSQTNN